MPDLPRLAAWLRMWADRLDDNGAIKRANDEADSYRPDPLLEDAKRFLDSVDRGGKLPSGWSLEAQAGREDRG